MRRLAVPASRHLSLRPHNAVARPRSTTDGVLVRLDGPVSCGIEPDALLAHMIVCNHPAGSAVMVDEMAPRGVNGAPDCVSRLRGDPYELLVYRNGRMLIGGYDQFDLVLLRLQR